MVREVNGQFVVSEAQNLQVEVKIDEFEERLMAYLGGLGIKELD